jgi:exosortase D (VPLPA-CTERM-specific)
MEMAHWPMDRAHLSTGAKKSWCLGRMDIKLSILFSILYASSSGTRGLTASVKNRNFALRALAISHILRFFPPVALAQTVSQVVQNEASTASPPPTFPTSVLGWQLGFLGALTLWLYWSTLTNLVGQWWTDPNFSHGFFVPLFSAFVIWQERDRLARIVPRPSWSGLIVLAVGLAVLVIGRMGAELFLDRSSMLLVLAGFVILFLGWNMFRATLFPWAFLLLMIPIPAIVFNQITFPLQLLASQVASTVLPVLGVPVLREGNVINLAAMPLEVAEACSGIRSLMSLVTLAIIYGYLLEKRLWVRWLLALAAVPITVVANDVRIVGTGLLVQYWGAEAAEGYFHASWGLITFVISLVMFYALHRLVRVVFPEKGGDSLSSSTPIATSVFPGVRGSTTSFILATLLIAAAAIFLHAHAGSEVFPPRLELKQFPAQLGGWTGTDVPIDKDVLDILRPSDYLLRIYQNPQETEYIDLFIPFFRSQRAGEAPHSPQHCLPGSGWTPVENQRVTLTIPGHDPFPANRYLITKGDSRQLVLYWFWAHDRGVASEYWAKYYLVADSIKMNRSDGSLVRITTPLYPGETADAAQQRLLPFVGDVEPLLDSYIPR